MFHQYYTLVFAFARLWNKRLTYNNKIKSKANSTLGFLQKNLKAYVNIERLLSMYIYNMKQEEEEEEEETYLFHHKNTQ